MSTNKIYTFGDGFATGHIWPEWPQILQALLPEVSIINTAAVGAGPEWLVHQLVLMIDDIDNSTVIFQWPQSNRFDKLIEDERWQSIADADDIYNFNQYISNNERWWLSSASTSQQIADYHNKYIQIKQHELRKKDAEILVKHALANLNCSYINISTLDQHQFSEQLQFKDIRQLEIQPSPPVHLAYLKERIIPNLTININPVIMNEIEQRINSHNWIAYDPDRDEIWAKMAVV